MVNKYTLLELNNSIQENIKLNYPAPLWVIAEISELKVNRNGHCYIELIEKDLINDSIIAKTRAAIWAYSFRMIKPYFESTTGQELQTGIKILIQATVEFHELYGLSLNITDIDPNYTIGDLAQKRKEILNKLVEEGIMNMNKEIAFPIIPQKIAIISSETAAGFQDFINQLSNNSFGFKFYTKLFPSIMQGKEAEDSIIDALEKIYAYEDYFDLVVIIRGGGSQSDLHCFNSYLLASNVAQFPLPILTGIGHDKDESIVDIVAHFKLKTPTAVAEYIIEKAYNFEEQLDYYKSSISEIISMEIQDRKDLLIHYTSLIKPIIQRNIDKHNFQLKITQEQLKNNSKQFIKNHDYILLDFKNQLGVKVDKSISLHQKNISNILNQLSNNYKLLLSKQNHKLESLENRIILLNPENVLKRGYSITYHNGKRLKNIDSINEKDEIKTKLFSGIIHSKISRKIK